ncbi:Os01g0254800, partial [Oryza sativa Japonica Group]
RSSLLLRSGLSDAALFSRLIPAPAPSSGRVRVRDSKSRWSDFSTPALASHRLRSARQQGLCREEKVELWKVIAGSFGSFFEDFSNWYVLINQLEFWSRYSL